MHRYRLVGPSYWDVFAFLWVGVGLVPVVVTLIMWGLGWPPSIVLIGVGGGGIGFVIAGLRFAFLFFKRRWLRETDDGFQYRDWRKEWTFTAADVVELGTWVRSDIEHVGETATTYVTGMSRGVVVQFGHPAFPRPVKLRYSWRPDDVDPFLALFTRLCDELADRAEKRVRDGGWLTGSGWTLTRDALTIDESKFEFIIPPAFDPRQRVIPLAQLTGVSVAEGALSVTFGKEEAYICAPYRGPNAGVMERVLGRLLATPAADLHPSVASGSDDFEFVQVDTPTAPAPTPGTEHSLGTPLFSLGAHTSFNVAYGLAGPAAVVYGGFGVVMLALGGIWFSATKNPETLWSLAVGVGCIVAAVLAEVYRRRKKGSPQLRIYTDGVAYAAPGRKPIELRYDRVEEFTYAAALHYVNGQFSYARVTMTFAGLNGTTLRHTEESALEANEHLDGIRDDVSRRVAAAMNRRLAAGGTVRWTGNLTFEPDGLSVRVTDDPDDDLLLDWDDVLLTNVKAGRFKVTSRRTGRVVKDLSTTAANFFPGFFLLQERAKAREAERKRATGGE